MKLTDIDRLIDSAVARCLICGREGRMPAEEEAIHFCPDCLALFGEDLPQRVAQFGREMYHRGFYNGLARGLEKAAQAIRQANLRARVCIVALGVTLGLLALAVLLTAWGKL